MRRVFILMAMTVSLLSLAAPSTAAAGFEIPIDTIVKDLPGTLTVLADVETPPEFIGLECIGLATATNQESVHPGNNLILETANTSVTLFDVEGEANKVTNAGGVIVLGDRVKVTLVMGEDGVFSGGFSVVIDVNCTQVPAPAITIEKTTSLEFYVDNTGEFTITVTNSGNNPLSSVVVADELAAIDPTSTCATTIGDLAVGEVVSYDCTIAGLDGKSPYTNVATVTGIDPVGTEVTATADVQIFPPLKDTTVTTVAPTTTVAPATTQAPGTTSAPSETLPVTGFDGAQAEFFGAAALVLVVAGIVMLGGAAIIGQRKSSG